MPDLIAIAKDPRAQSVALASLASALFLVLGSPDSDDPDREDKLAALGDALKDSAAETQPAAPDKLDTATIHAELVKLRAACPACIDIGGGLVQPGVEYEAGVNMPLGTSLVAVDADDCPGRLDGGVCILDPGAWSIVVGGCQERNEAVWCSVTATNTGDKAQRFLALVKAGP